MPVLDIDVSPAVRSLSTTLSSSSSSLLTTPRGLLLVEIQGDLSLPTVSNESPLFGETSIPNVLEKLHVDANGVDSSTIDNNNNNYITTSNDTTNTTLEIVKIGKLEIDSNSNKATLYISTSQRLLGTIETLDPPLALLKTTDSAAELSDVITQRIIFKQRPLPIM
ncbi:Ctf8 protein [Pichia kluyveri]|uniref:Ctf8 protein n=1 Tax=Pichia kluyveri TaxID=36015 RepID=A0AAV5R5F8_PICKL|nr:Ctf8 protein [Pichia kluyveri]